MIGTVTTKQQLSSMLQIDMDVGIALCNHVNKVVCPETEDDIPGRVLNISGTELDRVYQEIVRKTLVSLTQTAKEVILIPLSKDVENSDWTNTLVKSVKIKYHDMHQYVFRTFKKSLPSLTHGDIDTLERTIVNATVHEDKAFRWEFVNKSNGPKLDQRKEEIAKKLAFIESFLSPILQFQIKMALGFPDLPRGYIISNNALGHGGTYTETIGMAMPNKGLNRNKRNNGVYAIIPNVNCLSYIARAKSVVGSFERLEEEARLYLKKYTLPSGTFEVLDVQFVQGLYNQVCRLYNKPEVSVGVIEDNEKKMVDPILFRFNTSEGKVDFDMACLGMYSIYSILCQSVLVSMIENDTFINTDIPKNQLIDSENRIICSLRDSIITELTIMKSIYG
jgi:hypothetical protein